jgi:N-acetylmuramic acid 6-phosphate (MurNAc-6-P) etherase
MKTWEDEINDIKFKMIKRIGESDQFKLKDKESFYKFIDTVGDSEMGKIAIVMLLSNMSQEEAKMIMDGYKEWVDKEND